MASKDMTLQERLHEYIRSAWQGIVYDGELTICYETDKSYVDGNCTIYEADLQRHIVFIADSHSQQAAATVWDTLKSIKDKFPSSTRYNFSIVEIEGGMLRKILLTLELSSANL